MLKSYLSKGVLFSFTLASVLLITSSSFAQTARLPGVVDKSPKEDLSPSKSQLLPEDIPTSPLLDKPKLQSVENAHEVVATLTSIKLKGNTVLDDEDLQKIFKPYFNKPFTKGDLARLKYQITMAYYNKGYVLVRVVTPPQDFSDGILDIVAYEAKIGSVDIAKNDIVLPWVSRAIAKRSKTGDIISKQNVESIVLDLNDLENVAASLNFRPGEKKGTTNLDIRIKESDDDNHYLSVNNHGSDLTGKILYSGYTQYSNIYKMGETLSLDIQRSNGQLWNGGIGITTPIGFRNVKLKTYYSHSENDIEGRLVDLRASGKSDIFNAELYSKILNTRTNVLTMGFGLQSRTHRSSLNGMEETKDSIRKLYLDTSYLHRGDRALVYSSIRFAKGILGLGASQKGDATATRNLGVPEAMILSPLVVVNIPKVLYPNDTLKFKAKAQLASHILLSSDLFSVGGYNSLRGFDVAQDNGDMGYNVSVEYDYPLPKYHSRVDMSIGSFADTAAIYNRIDGSAEDAHFYSAGLFLEANIKTINKQNAILRLDWARPVGNYRSTKVSSDTVYFDLKYDF